MNELRIKLDADVLFVLEESAKEHGRDLTEEALEILRAEVRRRQRPTDPVEWARWIQAMTPVAEQTTDSLTIIREDRNR